MPVPRRSGTDLRRSDQHRVPLSSVVHIIVFPHLPRKVPKPQI